ncbi:MAG: 1-(5-phosphoribosyl)-5-((5-phosphoribosylamino)methylideneamino)imidazole-4-carboxamide isomerase [Candidatus Eremiobacteraeota bacterium]|nr:1-(5-phosphoribosyl)-5-((5-phosphoribosylamino)methylideneamino)imidazole-4-carboxamide isomerase [Candidatus Eremiobacteraeota bacterium]
MLVIPAIDLHKGKCVSMRQGDPSAETQYDDDAVERAESYVAAGAQRLQVIDLDGALESGENKATIASICQAVNVPVETGGGIRSLTDARQHLDAGASYIILGTVLVEDERSARNIIGALGEKVIAGIDARGENVRIHGWQAGSVVLRDALIKRVAGWGVSRIMHTEIGRDGTGEGYDIAALQMIAELGTFKVTASGGAKTVDDLRALKAAMPPNVDACVVGRALHEGTIDLAEAIKAVA